MKNARAENETPSLFQFATELETARCHLSTLLNCISQAVEDQDEGAVLTLLESARHFTVDIADTTKAMYSAYGQSKPSPVARPPRPQLAGAPAVQLLEA